MADYKEPIVIRYEETLDEPYAITAKQNLVDKAKSDRLISRYQNYIASNPADYRKTEATLSLIRKLIKLGWCWTNCSNYAFDGQLMAKATLSIPGGDHDSNTTKQPSPNSSSPPRVSNSCPTTGDINWSTDATKA